LEPVAIRFDRFELLLGKRKLLQDQREIALHGRGFDLLNFLIQNRDRALSRDEILAGVWGGVTVSPNNLSVQLSSLRKLLGDAGASDKLIQTLPGPSWRFVGEVEVVEAGGLAQDVASAPTPGPPKRRAALIASAALLAAGLAAWSIASGPPFTKSPEVTSVTSSAPPLSIVVLPLRTLADGNGLDYVADSVADDLTTALAHINGFTVIARGSADTYRGKAMPTQQIGRELNVRYVLEGSLRLAGQTYHINVQLIDAASGFHLWAQLFDVPRDHLDDTQEDIIRRIAAALHAKIENADAFRSLKDRPDNPQAIDFYLRAVSTYARHDDLPGVVAAQHLFEQALALSPDFVDALVAEGLLLISKATDYDSADAPDDLRRAHELIAHATQLAPDEAQVIYAQGDLRQSEGDLASARASFEAALAIDPNYTRAQTELSMCDWMLGRYESQLAHLQIAARQDPIGPAAGWRDGLLGMGNFMLGRYEDAIALFHRALATVPEGSAKDDLGREEWNSLYLMAAYALSGKVTQARDAWHRYDRSWPHRSVWRMLAYMTAAQAATPGYGKLRDGLVQAGMPLYSGLQDAADPPEAAGRETGGDFAPTPAAISGGRVVDASEVKRTLRDQPSAMVIDVGRGAAVVAGAIWTSDTSVQDTWPAEHLIEMARRDRSVLKRPVVVVETGVYGRIGYAAAQKLISAGFSQVLWFRGGEEAWAAAGFPAEDRRLPPVEQN